MIFDYKHKQNDVWSLFFLDRMKTAEDKLYELPEHLRVESQKKSEEMLSNQMLSGIPEVDLGIE